MATESRVATVMMSAQETVEGQAASSLLLASSMISNPLTVSFGPADFSDGFFVVESMRIDASQPC